MNTSKARMKLKISGDYLLKTTLMEKTYEKLVRKWVREEFSGEMRLDGRIMKFLIEMSSDNQAAMDAPGPQVDTQGIEPLMQKAPTI